MVKEEDLQIDDAKGLYEHYSWVVDKGQGALRIDKFLTDKIENGSRTKMQAAIKAGSVLVNGVVIKSNYKVRPLDNISIVMAEPPREIELIPEDIPLDVVYEDEHLIVINKQAGLVVHPGYGNYTGTLVNALAYYIKDSELFKKDNVRPGLVHRIDKNTSGLLVIAKTELALLHLAKQFYEHTTERKYIAMVWGNFDEDKGTITGYLDRDKKDRKKMHVYETEEEGKWSVTHYKVLERLAYVTLIECQLETGRTHQIRVHLEYIKHPLFNDEKYGGNRILKGTTFSKYKQFVENAFKLLPRHALHAKTLGFIHPATGEKMLFNSDYPEDMSKVIEKWRVYTNSRRNEL